MRPDNNGDDKNMSCDVTSLSKSLDRDRTHSTPRRAQRHSASSTLVISKIRVCVIMPT